MNWKFWRRGSTDQPDPTDPNWERALIGRMATEYLRERRRRRRWSTLFKALVLIYLFAVLVSLYSEDLARQVKVGDKHTALIEVNGLIAPETQASADRVISALRAAFKDERTKGIVLRINSPGGSAVQAGYVYDEIGRLKAEYEEEHGEEMPVYAVAVDVCASGGYYIAAAADEIYANAASLVGSIGVRLDSFGFSQLLEDLGIERRLLTAGENKGILDPFSPLREPQEAFLQSVLDELHQQFITAVKEGRGDRLTDDPEVFSGLFWSGARSVDLGLVDGLGSSSYVARELIGAESIVDFTRKWDWLERFTDQLGTAMVATLGRLTTTTSGAQLR